MPKHDLPPDLLADLIALRERLAAAPPKEGERGVLVANFARGIGKSPQTVHAWLKRHAGYATERKRRADAGRTRLAPEALAFIASSRLVAQRQNARANATQPIAVAMNIAAQNGFDINVGEGTVARLLRQQQMDIKTQANARNHLRLRSLHPNHVHQIDPSLCLLFYMGGKQYLMREEAFNKNKPVALEKVKLKVWRYTRYDHASRSIDVRYYEAAGENQASLFEFLLYTWGKAEGRLSYGVPQMLLWDKGSANTSAGIRRLLDALGVQHETHATHHAWVKGGVEAANYIVERHFESRLRAEPVHSVQELNQAAAAWVRDYNANAIEHVDARVRCDDGQLRVRDDMWSAILQTPAALLDMPPRQVCAWFMTGKEHTRQVRDGRITFVHPQSGKSELYDLQAWASEIYNGQKLALAPLLLGDCALRIELPTQNGQSRYIEVEPVREFDAFGRPLAAPVMGQERRQAPHTAAQAVGQRLAEATWGEGVTPEQAEQLRAKNARPFAHLNDGKGAVAHSHLGQAETLTRLLPKAQPVQTEALAQAQTARTVARTLTQFEAAAALAAPEYLGQRLSPEQVALLRSLHPQGVPEDRLPDLATRLKTRAALRVINGRQ